MKRGTDMTVTNIGGTFPARKGEQAAAHMLASRRAAKAALQNARHRKIGALLDGLSAEGDKKTLEEIKKEMDANVRARLDTAAKGGSGDWYAESVKNAVAFMKNSYGKDDTAANWASLAYDRAEQRVSRLENIRDDLLWLQQKYENPETGAIGVPQYYTPEEDALANGALHDDARSAKLLDTSADDIAALLQKIRSDPGASGGIDLSGVNAKDMARSDLYFDPFSGTMRSQQGTLDHIHTLFQTISTFDPVFDSLYDDAVDGIARNDPDALYYIQYSFSQSTGVADTAWTDIGSQTVGLSYENQPKTFEEALSAVDTLIKLTQASANAVAPYMDAAFTQQVEQQDVALQTNENANAAAHRFLDATA